MSVSGARSDDRRLDVLVLSPTRHLREEIEHAAEQGQVKTRCDTVTDDRHGRQRMADRAPDLVVVDVVSALWDIGRVVEDIRSVAPSAFVVGAYGRESFPDPERESAFLLEAVRAGVRDFLERPVSVDRLDAIVRRWQSESGQHALPPRGHVVSFVGNKGGVGKSVLAVNTACELARRHPGRTLLVDASLQLGTCASMLDLEPRHTLADAGLAMERLDATLIQELCAPHPSGLSLVAAPPDMVAASGVDEAIVSRVVTLAQQSFDFVVVDTFPVLDAVVLAVLDLSDVTFVLTQPLVPIVEGTAAMLDALDRVGVDEPRVRVVLNHGQRRFPGQLSPAAVEASLSRDVDHVVPYDRRMPVCVNAGTPLVGRGLRFSAFHRALRAVVDDVEATTSTSPSQSTEPADEPADSVPSMPVAHSEGGGP